MSTSLPPYSAERLAAGSYDILIDGARKAALLRNVDRTGAARDCQLDLRDETSATERPSPFSAQRHVSCTLAAALELLGIRRKGVADALGERGSTPHPRHLGRLLGRRDPRTQKMDQHERERP